MTLSDTSTDVQTEVSRETGLRRGKSEIPEPAGSVDPKRNGLQDDGPIALLVRVQVPDQPGVLHALTSVIFKHRANITYLDIADKRQLRNSTSLTLSDVNNLDTLVADLEALPIVRAVERKPSFGRIYGKRIIVIGGGAQVGQVVLGAVPTWWSRTRSRPA